MARKIRWSKTGCQTYLDILLDIQEKWGDNSAIKLDGKLQKVLTTISQMPHIYPASQKVKSNS